jgi:hypothetical protein
MTYETRLSGEAESYLRRLDEATQERTRIRMAQIASDPCREEYEYYRCFELFGLLDNPDNMDRLDEAAGMFLMQVERYKANAARREWRSFSVLRRMVSVGLEKFSEPARSEVVRILLERDSIAQFEEWMIRKLASSLKADERKELFNTIDFWIPVIPFNGFHLNVLRFYRKMMPDKDLSEISKRLEELKYH